MFSTIEVQATVDGIIACFGIVVILVMGSFTAIVKKI